MPSRASERSARRSTDKANLPADQRTVAHFINTSAFSITPQFKLGNASRDPARGPAYRDLDLGLVKNTAIRERLMLELRGEVFNVTNTPAFAQPNATVVPPTMVNGVGPVTTTFGSIYA